MHLQAWDSYYFSAFGVETKLRTYSMVGARISSSRYSLLFLFFIFKYTLYLCACVCVCVCVWGGGGGCCCYRLRDKCNESKVPFSKIYVQIEFLAVFRATLIILV